MEKASKGEVGYLHIRSMDAPSLRRFERDLVENHDKKALIIDQRFNPGGGIDQELLEILACPNCKTPVVLVKNGAALKCGTCKRVYPIKDDIPVMLIDEATIEE